VATSPEALAKLGEIERMLADVEEREALLDRLAPRPDERAAGPDDSQVASDPGPAPLRGPAIRETAVRVLVRRGGIEAPHYREWFELLARAGYGVAGKDPVAVFLTQISRSPVVRKGTQAGVYELDRHAPQRLARELDRLQAELRELTGRSPGTTHLGEIRARREQLTSAIGRAERALEEARRVLVRSDNPAPDARLAAAG
jgi:hypothetical protein